jgi:hypothetical protein
MRARKSTGVVTLHSTTGRSTNGARCSRSPKYLAVAFDRRAGKRVDRTFPTLAAATSWRPTRSATWQASGAGRPA